MLAYTCTEGWKASAAPSSSTFEQPGSTSSELWNVSFLLLATEGPQMSKVLTGVPNRADWPSPWFLGSETKLGARLGSPPDGPNPMAWASFGGQSWPICLEPCWNQVDVCSTKESENNCLDDVRMSRELTIMEHARSRQDQGTLQEPLSLRAWSPVRRCWDF